eukprot:6799554-Lingulodinium_polyedra.AAC.1
MHENTHFPNGNTGASNRKFHLPRPAWPCGINKTTKAGLRAKQRAMPHDCANAIILGANNNAAKTGKLL